MAAAVAKQRRRRQDKRISIDLSEIRLNAGVALSTAESLYAKWTFQNGIRG